MEDDVEDSAEKRHVCENYGKRRRFRMSEIYLRASWSRQTRMAQVVGPIFNGVRYVLVPDSALIRIR